MEPKKFKDHLLSIAKERYGVRKSDIPESDLSYAVNQMWSTKKFMNYLEERMDLKHGALLLATCNDILNAWKIVDDKEIIYSGSQALMEEVFERMTVPLSELIRRYPERNPRELKASVSRWKKSWSGKLQLIEVHDVYRNRFC